MRGSSQDYAKTYRLVLEVLTMLRQLVASGRADGCVSERDEHAWPEPVVSRLQVLRLLESAIESPEPLEDDLIHFADFADLAEILDHDDELVERLVGAVAPSKDRLMASLVELEYLSEKLSRGRSVSPRDGFYLHRMHRTLGSVLAQHQRDGRPATEPRHSDAHTREGQADDSAAPEITSDEPVEHEVSEIDSSPTGEAAVEPVSAPGAPISVAEIGPSAASAGPGKEEAADPPDHDELAGAPPPQAPDSAPVGAESGEPSAPHVADDPGEDSNADYPFIEWDPELSAALAGADAPGVLQVLHREVVALAESIHACREIGDTPVWTAVSDCGWAEANREALQLEPLDRFYDVVARYRALHLEGASETALRSFLSGERFSDQLIQLGVIFRNAW